MLKIKENKYKNKKVIVDGITFDSKKEANYYSKLKLLEKGHVIKDLELQKAFELQPSFKLNNKTYRKIEYRADFCYKTTHDDKLHVVDTKGYRTKEYILKKKMIAYKYGIEIEEV